MIKRITSLVGLLTVLALLLTACGASDTPTPVAAPTNTTAPAAAATDTPAAAAATNTAPAATDTAAPAAPTATTASAGASGKIAILLPETKTARYETPGPAQLQGQAQALGFDVSNLIYSNANQDANAQQVAGRGRPDQRRQSAGARPGRLRRGRGHRRRGQGQERAGHLL